MGDQHYLFHFTRSITFLFRKIYIFITAIYNVIPICLEIIIAAKRNKIKNVSPIHQKEMATGSTKTLNKIVLAHAKKTFAYLHTCSLLEHSDEGWNWANSRTSRREWGFSCTKWGTPGLSYPLACTPRTSRWTPRSTTPCRWSCYREGPRGVSLSPRHFLRGSFCTDFPKFSCKKHI